MHVGAYEGLPKVYTFIWFMYFDKLERYNDAEQCFRQIINNDPDNAEHYNGLAVFLTKQNKIEEAVSVYKKSIPIDPDYFELLNNLADALQKKGWFRGGQ